MKVTEQEYSEMTDKASPGSSSFKNISLAFLFGGAICLIGEILSAIYVNMGMTLKDAQGVVSVTLVGLGALLTGLRIYDNIAKHAGAGTLVPITGFANSIVAPAIEFKREGHIMGIGSKMFIIAGPVLVFGVTAAIVYGLIAWVFNLY